MAAHSVEHWAAWKVGWKVVCLVSMSDDVKAVLMVVMSGSSRAGHLAEWTAVALVNLTVVLKVVQWVVRMDMPKVENSVGWTAVHSGIDLVGSMACLLAEHLAGYLVDRKDAM